MTPWQLQPPVPVEQTGAIGMFVVPKYLLKDVAKLGLLVKDASKPSSSNMPNMLYGFTANSPDIVTNPLIETAANPQPKKKRIPIPFDA